MNFPMTLEQYIGQAPMKELDLVRMGSQIASALAVVHQQNRIHGDVKPGNILVLGDGNYQLIGMDAERKYPQGVIPAFVAPELSQGAAYHPGVDIYSLGMMMNSLKPRNNQVSGVLEEMIQKACKADPSERYSSAYEFSNELEMMYEVLLQMNPQPAPRMEQPVTPPQPVRQPQPASRMEQPVRQPQPVPRMEQPVRQPQPKRTNVNQNAGNNQQSLALRFILPILIVLVVSAAVIAYVVLIRPSLNKNKETTQEMLTTTEKDPDGNMEAANDADEKEERATEETKKMIVPVVEGLDETTAKTQLESANLKCAISYELSDTVEKGKVISQNVVAGTEVEEGTEIALVVSEGNGCPYEYSQKVTVTANPGSTNGVLTLYDWENGDWQSKFSCSCVVGKNGIGSNYGEGKGVTPLGTYKLGFVLGTVDPNNNMTFKQAYSTTAIVDDTSSSLYNTLVDTNSVSGISVDHVGNNIVSGKLSCVIFIEHNGNGITSDNVIRGNGSVITICGNYRNVSSTAGCIDITASDMSSLLTYLDGTKNPYIETKLN